MTLMQSPEMERGRRVAFVIAKAEAHLGLNQTGLPLDDRLHATLSEAAMRPGELDPGSYAVLYQLLHVNQEA